MKLFAKGNLGKTYNYASAIVLALLPKCSLCLFALGSAITMCGVDVQKQPLWEYVLIALVCLLPLVNLICKCKQGISLSSIFIMAGGSFMILYFLWSGQTMQLYFEGIGLLVIGSFYEDLRRIISAHNKKEHCK